MRVKAVKVPIQTAVDLGIFEQVREQAMISQNVKVAASWTNPTVITFQRGEYLINADKPFATELLLKHRFEVIDIDVSFN